MVVARFKEIVSLYPDRLAVKCKTAKLWYCELNQTANRIAGTLLNRYGRTEEAVGVLVQEESPAIAAILGVLKAGRFYVPLDRTFPSDRLRSIINDCQLQVLLTEQEFVGWANDLDVDCAVIALEDIDARVSAENAVLMAASPWPQRPSSIHQAQRGNPRALFKTIKASCIGSCRARTRLVRVR